MKKPDKVLFLYNECNDDLFAYFPNITMNNNGDKLCYSQIGQHSGCCVEYANESIKATKEEVQPLFNELVGVGYNIESGHLIKL